MEQNELGPTDLREDLFDHFCEKLDNFCRQYSEEEKQMLAATTPTKRDEDVPDFVKKVLITKHTSLQAHDFPSIKQNTSSISLHIKHVRHSLAFNR